MRIISGSLKGRSIQLLKNSLTRPLKDSVKENIFNILEHSNLIKVNIKCSNVLDLYSGIGSFGLETISRGASKATFIERDLGAFRVLSKNISKLSISNRATILNDNIESFLNKKSIEKFHIFFLDPPFKDFGFLKNLELIKRNKLFEENHIVIIHREKKTNDSYSNIIKIIDKKKYGRSKIIFGKFS